MSKNYPKEILVEKMILTHKSSDKGEVVTDFLLPPRPMFERLTIYESMFRSFISGAVLIHDKDAKGIENVFAPGDVLEFTIRSPGRESDEDPGKDFNIKTVVFKVECITPKENPSVKGYVFHFASPSYAIYNQIESDHVFDEFFGSISNNELSEHFSSSISLPETAETGGDGGGLGLGGGGGGVPDWVGGTNVFGEEETENDSPEISHLDCGKKLFDYEKLGFVNDIIKNRIAPIDEVEYEIEGTKNSIWYRQFFPLTSAKLPDYKTESIFSILSQCKNFAQNSENPYAVNFYMWQDLDGIHFKSVEKLISEQADMVSSIASAKQNDKIFVHAPDIDQQDSYAKFNRVNTLKITQYADMLNLISKGAFGAMYRYWLKPRLDLVDSYSFDENEMNFEMSREEINYLIDKNTYSYFYSRDRTKWKSIEDEPLISSTSTEEMLKPSLTNIIRPQLISSTNNDYSHGYNILDDSPLTSFYNHYLHTDLDVCTLKDIMFVQKAMVEPTEKFYNHLIRKRIWDFKQKMESESCATPMSYSYYSDPDSPNSTSLGVRDYMYRENPPFPEPSVVELADLAASIPDECSLIENVLGEEYLGCATRDYWYYGSLQRSTPTARKKSHTNAELSFFKDICSRDPSFLELLDLDGESDSINWSDTFPGLFSEGPLCTCPCQNSSSATRDKNFHRYMEYTNTFSRYWNTDHWVPMMRNAQHQLLKSQQLQFTTSGNLKRKPGEIIFLHLPLITAATNAEVNLEQGEYMQGKYMITSIKHQITSNNTHTMEVEACRDGFSVPYTSIDPTTMGNKGIINTTNEWIGGYDTDVASSGSFWGGAAAGGGGGDGAGPEDIPGGGVFGVDDVSSFGSDFSQGTSSVFERDLNVPGYLNPGSYQFFKVSKSSSSDDGVEGFGYDDIFGTPVYGAFTEGGLLVGGDNNDDDSGNGGEVVDSEFIIDGKSVAQLYKEATSGEGEDKDLSFINSALVDGMMQNFSRYDWNQYGGLIGQTDSSNNANEAGPNGIDSPYIT